MTYATIGISIVKPDIENMIEQFISGNVLSKELSEFIFSNIALAKRSTYADCLSQIKQILNHSKINYYKDFMIIKSSTNISEYQKAVMVRFINLCVNNRDKIIIFNNNAIYIPDDLRRKYGEDVASIYINSSYRDYINKRKRKYIIRKFKIKPIITFFTNIKKLLMFI